MKAKALPSRERLMELLEYNKETGIFTWKVKASKSVEPGMVAGKNTAQICIDYVLYLKHRLAWLYCYGEPVPELIDHIDRNNKNNCIANLRAATISENVKNSDYYDSIARDKVLTFSEETNIVGVSFHKNRYGFVAYYKGKHLGIFDTIEKAKQARQVASGER